MLTHGQLERMVDLHEIHEPPLTRFQHTVDGCEILRQLIEGSLEVKLPTIWRDEKQSRAEAEEKRLEERRSEEKESEERRCRCAKR